MSEPILERRDGQWFMLLGHEASLMDAVISAMLNAKVARMTEAQRAKPETPAELEEMAREICGAAFDKGGADPAIREWFVSTHWRWHLGEAAALSDLAEMDGEMLP